MIKLNSTQGILIFLMASIITLTGCNKDSGSSAQSIADQPIEEITTPLISSVQYQSNSGFAVTGLNLIGITGAKLVKDSVEETLVVQEINATSAVFKFFANKTLAKGIWNLIVKNAYGQTASSVYLDVQDGSITDSKIVSVAASKITGVLAKSLIPNLATSYAAIVSGKVDTSVLPDLSTTYSVIGHTHSNTDILSLAANKITGQLMISAIPNLSASYAALSSGRISINQIPNLSVSYSVLGHVHSANDVGAVSASIGSTDAGKIVKLNGNGLVDSTMLPGPGVAALLHGNDQLYGRLISGFPCFSIDCGSTDNTTVVLPDGAHYITQLSDFSYSGYIKTVMSESITNYFIGGSTPRNYPGVCLFTNTTCSGNCGFQNKPIKNALLQRYNSSAQIEWMKATGNDNSVTFDLAQDASFRNPSGTCVAIDSNEVNTFIVNLYQFSTGYTLPVSAIPMTGLYIGIK